LSRQPSPDGSGKKGNPLSVLRNPNYAKLFAAGATSIGGFSLGQVALTWVVFVTTRSALDVAYLAVASTVASSLLSVVGGTLVDRQDRKSLMILCDASRALGLAVLAVYLYALGFNLPLVLAASFILGGFSAVFNPAERALTPSVLAADELADANGLVQVTTSVFQSLASAVGGAVVASIGVVTALGLNVATFAISGSLIASMALGGAAKTVARPASTVERKSFIEDARDGIGYLISQKGLLYLTLSAGLVNLFFGMVTPFVVVYAANALGGGASTYGLLLALFAIGLGPGALLVGKTGAVSVAGKVWVVSGFLSGIMVLLLALTSSLVLALALFFALGVLTGYATVTWLSAVQLLVPSEMQGRYFGVDQLGSFAAIPVGQVIGALVIQSSSVQYDFLVAAVGMCLASLGFLASNDLRALGYAKRPR
jgi:DHA3 family macrolide efflux protein-like MFS transporter